MADNRSGTHPNDSKILEQAGLNLRAVFELADLPAEVLASIHAIEPATGYRQLLLFGHGGRDFWQALSESDCATREHPVDQFSADTMARFFSKENPGCHYSLLYPRSGAVPPLQQLGRLAGWHHDSPLLIGVNARWGAWFAYRAAALADTSFAPSAAWAESSPCEHCIKPCLQACPVSVGNAIGLDACIAKRMQEGSPCATSCPARLACPVQSEKRYVHEQMRYHYGCSLATIREVGE